MGGCGRCLLRSVVSLDGGAPDRATSASPHIDLADAAGSVSGFSGWGGRRAT